MSDRREAYRSGFGQWSQWSQDSRETIFHNANSNFSRTLNNAIATPLDQDSRETVFYNADSNFSRMLNNVVATPLERNVNIKSSLENNSVGSLQDLCTKHHCPYPTYTCVDENVFGSDTRFTVECSISSYKVTGIGKTKKAAKTQAAYLMYDCLVKLTSFEIKHICNNERGLEDKANSARESMSKKLPSNKQYLKFQESVTQLNMFFEQKLQNMTPCLNQNSKNSELEAFDVLKKIAHIEDVSVKHFIFSPNHEKEEFDVLIQYTTNPVTVVLGKGKDVFGALAAAALNTLSYMKTIIENS